LGQGPHTGADRARAPAAGVALGVSPLYRPARRSARLLPLSLPRLPRATRRSTAAECVPCKCRSEQTCALRSKLANFANMRTVRVGELRNHLSRYLRMVRNGGRVVVLDRETPIAELGPATSGRAPVPATREEGG